MERCGSTVCRVSRRHGNATRRASDCRTAGNDHGTDTSPATHDSHLHVPCAGLRCFSNRGHPHHASRTSDRTRPPQLTTATCTSPVRGCVVSVIAAIHTTPRIE